MTLVAVSLAASLALARGADAAKNEKQEHGKPSAKANVHAKDGAPATGKGPDKRGAAGKGDGPAKDDSEKAEDKAAKGAERRAEHAEFKSKLAELKERSAQGQLSPADLKKELAALRESRDSRRREHREALRARWGNKLTQPSAQEELAHHERRMARLERMALLAQSEPKGAKKDALVARIDKLTARENERHERKMAQLEASANAKAASAGAQKPEKQAVAEPATDQTAEKGAVR